MHWQFPRVLKNPIYTRKFTEFTDFTDLTTLQTYRFLVDRSRTISAPGPPAHARGLQHEALRRGGSAALQEGGGSEMSVVARRERCVNSFPRAHAHEEVGAAGPVRLVAAAQAHYIVGGEGKPAAQ